MTDTDNAVIEALDSRVRRREERRMFFKVALGAAAIGTGALVAATPAAAQTITDADVLNFALNLEYLEAQFYSYAVFGTGLAANQQTGSGTQGGVTGGAQVPFASTTVAQYAREIAQDEIAHVAYLRTAIGSASVVAQPALNIAAGTSAAPGAFTLAARAAGVVGPTDVFDPYASDAAFLQGAFIFEDVGVTAYKGSAGLLSSKVFLEAAAGILAVEAYHAALIRTTLYEMGVTVPALRTNTDKISDARDFLDGTANSAGPPALSADDDQGISPVTYSGGTASNIVPADVNGLAYGRTAAQVLNIVYLNKAAVTLGGFFPAGVNGTIKTSANNA